MTTPPEDLEIRSVGDVVVAAIRGEVDLFNAVSVRERLLGAVPNQAAGLALDLSATHYLDSSGLRLIFELADRLHRRGQKLGLVVPDDSVIRGVLVLTEVEQVAAMFASLEDALPG
jgi:anti-anti-sigma factor